MALLGVLCRSYGVTVNLEVVWSLKRNGLSNRAALSKQGISTELTKSICDHWERMIESFPWLGFDKFIPGSIETLERWSSKGNSVHLLSARRNLAAASQQIRQYRLHRLFSSIKFVDPYERDAKRQHLSSLSPDVYLADTELDFFQSEKAGVRPILLSTGMRSAEYLEQKTGIQAHCGWQSIVL